MQHCAVVDNFPGRVGDPFVGRVLPGREANHVLQ